MHESLYKWFNFFFSHSKDKYDCIRHLHCTGIDHVWLSTFSGPEFSSLWPPSEPLKVKVNRCPVFSQHASLACCICRRKSAHGKEASGLSTNFKEVFVDKSLQYMTSSKLKCVWSDLTHQYTGIIIWWI